jgi:PTH1 family peptidyl-tRNA hydrolase
MLQFMKLIIWLWNPGTQYQNTRHNIGFIMLDSFFDDFKSDKKSNSLVSTDSAIFPSGVIWVKPETFMNLSGNTVSAMVSYYKLDPKKDILVISDDIDMEFGKVRYRAEGSHGGQNGLRDIILKTGTTEFARIKIGIGRHEHMSVSDWVLSQFTQDERKMIDIDIQKKVQEYIIKWLWGSINI